MQFIKKSKYHAESDCGKYTICRANDIVGGTYTAVRNGKPDTIIGTARFADDADRVRAYKEVVAVCEGDARG